MSEMTSKLRSSSMSDRFLTVFCYVFLTLIIVITLYPFWEQLVISISPREEALAAGPHLFTLAPDFSAYKKILNSTEVWRSFGNSTQRVILAVIISVPLTSLTAYPLSKSYFPLGKLFTALILFTMLFSGGLIPTYLLMKNLHLIDKIWVLILPNAVTAYNLIIVRNFMKSLPQSLEESARLDGANDFVIWRKIVLPLSLPVMATIALWVAVGNWNAYFDALIYINDRDKFVLPVILRRILIENQLDMFIGENPDSVGMVMPTTEESKKAALVMISILPIAMFYPFLQKYFSKGIMLGAVKG